MNNFSIDLETLGTNVTDTVLSCGICKFDPKTGDILATLEVHFDYDTDTSLSCTTETIAFWLMQVHDNPEAVAHVFKPKQKLTPPLGLNKIYSFINPDEHCQIWANGTKFDLGMIEYMFKQYNIMIPWSFNSDRCMRTLRSLCGSLDVDMSSYTSIAHTALSDAICQAKYISACLKELGQ